VPEGATSSMLLVGRRGCHRLDADCEAPDCEEMTGGMALTVGQGAAPADDSSCQLVDLTTWLSLSTWVMSFAIADSTSKSGCGACKVHY
jgi:hypothetical protein